MFTGMVAAVGVVTSVEPSGGDVRIGIEATALGLADLALGHSVAVAGVCLTIAALESTGFAADVSRETLGCTTLGEFRPGRRVNLEKSLRAGDPLGGHFVTGHVDGVGRVLAVVRDARSARVTIEVPAGLARYLASKGSVTVDGTSLTLNEVAARQFGVNLVPHTQAVTTLGDLAPGDGVNIEVDVLSRYLERLREAGPP
jgi:riboflavin synthase